MIHYTFPYLISPHLTALNEYVDGQIHRLLGDNEMKKKFAQANLAYLAARAFPESSLERLVTFTKSVLFFFINDDLYEHQEAKLQLPAFERYIRIMEGESPLIIDDGLCHLLASIREDLVRYMSSNWINRFTNHFRHCILATAEENPYRNSNCYPPLDSYLSWREVSGAMMLVIDFIEVAQETELPEHIYSHPVVQELIGLTNRISILCNDFYSLPKDIADNEVFNYALIYSHVYQLDVNAGKQALKDLHDAASNRFLQLRFSLQDFGEEILLLEPYVNGLEKWMQANLSWMMIDSGRYALK